MIRRLAVTAAAALLVTTIGVLPGTPAWADQTRQSQWPLQFLHVAEAQQITQGEGVTVAVIDTGVNPNQADISGNVLGGYDDWSGAKDGHTDKVGHGTGVSALIAGHGHGADGGDGVLGVAPKAKILPYGIYAPDDPDNMQVGTRMVAGIRWAVDHGAQVICIASGGGGATGLESAVKYALDKGVPIVTAAANLPDLDIGYPAVLPGVIAVTSVDEQGRFAEKLSTSGDGVGFSAPGTNITVPKASSGYTTVNGNSAAAALTAGTVALVRAKYPTLTPAQITQRLKATATDHGVKGWDRQYGNGVIDPVAALTQEIVDPSRSATAAPSSESAAAAPYRYTTSQTVIGYVFLAVFVLFAAGAVAAIVVVVRRRRRGAPAASSPWPSS